MGTNGFDDEWRGADGLLSDIHGSADYRANLIKVTAQRAVAAAMGAVEGLLSRQEVG